MTMSGSASGRARPREGAREADPASIGRQREKLLAPLPDDEPAEKRYQKAMRIVGVVPPLPRQITQDPHLKSGQQPQEAEDEQRRSQARSSGERVKTMTLTR
jgi:hypothetical protein